AVGHLGQVEAGAEVLTGRGQHDRRDALGWMGEELAEAADRLIVKGIAFGRTVEGEDADLAVASEAEGVREVDGRRLGGCLGRVGRGEVGQRESLNMSSEEERAQRWGVCARQ